LDPVEKLPKQAQTHGKEDSKKIWISPRQAGESNNNSIGTG
jgi:hypothetical protein